MSFSRRTHWAYPLMPDPVARSALLVIRGLTSVAAYATSLPFGLTPALVVRLVHPTQGLGNLNNLAHAIVYCVGQRVVASQPCVNPRTRCDLCPKAAADILNDIFEL